jgi:hypothetical protein
MADLAPAPAPRERFGIPARDQQVVGGLVVAFLALRVLTVRSTPVVWFDSGGYEHLDLLGRAERLPTVPLLYAIVSSYYQRILAQAAISAACWVALALAAGSVVADRRVRVGAVAGFLALGLTTQITNWDSAILSDSVTLSLTALLVAVWVRFVRRPDPSAVALVAGVTVLWTLTRELHVYITLLVALAAVLVAARLRTRQWVVLAAALAAVGVGAYVIDRQNTDTITDNVGNIVGGRVLTDPAIRAWFEDRGMPVMRQFETGKGLMGAEVREDPAFEAWAREEGMGLWVEYLLTHPVFALDGPYGELLEDRNTFAEDLPNSVLLSPEEAYGRTRPVLPEVVEGVLFAPGRTGSLLAIFAAAVAATIAAGRRYGVDRRWWVPMLAILLVPPYLFLSYNGSTLEHGRHAMPAALAFRLGTFLLLALALDRLLGGRSVDVGGERVAHVTAEVDDGVGEGDRHAGIGDEDGEALAEGRS